MNRNIEIKATCDDLDGVRAAARELSARLAGIEEQCDTYFRTARGRLKLRRRFLNIEGDGAGVGHERFELIWYQRPDTTTAKGSDYHLIHVIDGSELRRILADGLGVLAEVHKRRTVYLWRNVRIHLDEVERLGSFVELEAIVDESGDEASARAKIDHLREALDIQPDQLIDVSYSELLLSANSSSTKDSNLARSS
ncbi:MAG: class IV adenylate cyclase [Planctomycetota bacterium]|nr:class IV adenylate cyclase [Planctomycetota bacterium]